MKTDVAIVGGGPAGTCSALWLAASGIESVIIEKENFPRFHIGESMTGEAGALLRDLGLETHIDVTPHAIKHGVKVYGAHTWFVPVMQRTPEGELAEQIAYQVKRDEFDSMLLAEAASRGATVAPGKAVEPLLTDDGEIRGVHVRSAEGEFDLEAEVVLDCSGQATFLSAHGVTGPKYLGAYDKQIAIFSHVTGFALDRGANGDREKMPGNTLIFYKHKFHWGWAIPIDDQRVSVGVVIPSQYFLDTGESKADFLSRELREIHPELERRMADAVFVEEMHAIPNYSFQVRGFANRRFICVGDSHRFIDPIFSFGLDIAIHESRVAADTVARFLAGEGRDDDELWKEHMERCERRGDVYEDFIDAFWEHPLAFAVFTNSRYRDTVIDTFAGRNWGLDDQPYGAIQAFRKLMKRERVYDDDGLYSVPIGSRFHPERAPLWNAVLDSVETTERWMRDLEHEQPVVT
jgi:flavin-dependent dehydrogenase